MREALLTTFALTCLACATAPEASPHGTAGRGGGEPTTAPPSDQPMPRSNQRQGQVSPSGKYILSVDCTFRLKVLEPVHRVTITEPDGNLLYRDDDSRFFAGLNVYFGWDPEDRVWLYNSDDGGLWCWSLDGDDWTKSRASDPDQVPTWILPDYARTEDR